MKPRNVLANDYHNRLPEGPFQKSFVHGAFVDGYDAGYQAAKDQFADADKVMNSPEKLDSWISVKERLPEHFEDVLTFEDGECYRVNSISELTKYWWDSDEGFERNPSHWMPLPKPPEDK